MKDLLIGLLVGFLLGSYVTGSIAIAEIDRFDLDEIVDALKGIEDVIILHP